jgi:hypothetical protein
MFGLEKRLCYLIKRWYLVLANQLSQHTNQSHIVWISEI